MEEKTNWRAFVVEDGLVLISLMGIGIAVVALKLMPIILRWSKGR